MSPLLSAQCARLSSGLWRSAVAVRLQIGQSQLQPGRSEWAAAVAAAMEFRILGPLEVVDNGHPIEIGGHKQRALLAVLLLQANEIVSADVLVDALWGESPPPTAAKTVQVYVSRLRKVLGQNGAGTSSDVRVETRGPGYMLRVGEAELDANVFRTMLEAARNALAAGDPEAAADGIRGALALWRASPLADLAYESFAQAEIARLDELRLAAQEEWVEAQLALGRHAEVVPDLEALVRRHPLRERLLGQLMLALYRSDRQGEALHAYQEGRRELAQELGLEPSQRLQTLERRILEHDPELAAPPRRGRPRVVPAPVWRHPKVVLLLGALVFASALAAGIFQLVRDSGGGASELAVVGNAVAALDAGSGRVGDAVEAPAPPTAMAAGHGFIWAASADSNTVVVVDPETSTIRDTIAVESAPGGIAIGGGWVWVTNSLTGTVSQISPETHSVVQTIPVGNGPTGIAAGGGHVWVANTSDHTVTKLRASDGKRVETFAAVSDPGAVAFGDDAVWVASKLTAAVLKLSPSSGEVLDRIPVGDGPAGVAVDARSVWIANSLSGTVTRVDPRTGDVRGTIEVGSSADAIAAVGDDVWVAGGLAGTVSRVRARDGHVSTIDLHHRPTALAAGGGTVYIGLRPTGASHVGGTLRVLVSNPLPRQIDTATAYAPDTWTALAMTNDGLVGWRRVGGQAGTELVPDLAVSLPSVSDDGRRYSFQLPRGVRYSDGGTVKASDVRYSIERLYKLKPRREPAAGEAYGAIVGADGCSKRPSRCDLSRGIVTDDRAGTVAFRLARPDPEFLFKLALPFGYVLPAGTSLHEAAQRPLPATGPYRFASVGRGGSLRLVRNPRFRQWSSAAQPAGFPDEIVMRPLASGTQAARLVAEGKADFTSTDSGGPPIAPANRSQLHVQPSMGTFYLVADVTRPPFDDVHARRAINYALDRNKVVRLVGGPSAARPTCQVLPPNFPGYEPHCPYTVDPDPSAGWTAADTARARRLVRASGRAGAEVELWWHRDFGERAGRYLEQVLDSLGYRTRLRLFSGDLGKYFRAVEASGASWHLAGSGWFADSPAASNFINLFSCSAPYNIGRFCDSAIDVEIRRALRLQERNPAAANESWAALDRELTERAPWIFLYTPYSEDFVSKRVGNYQHHPLWGTLFAQLWVR
jgi:YVTN family beta-propeller protein